MLSNIWAIHPFLPPIASSLVTVTLQVSHEALLSWFPEDGFELLLTPDTGDAVSQDPDALVEPRGRLPAGASRAIHVETELRCQKLHLPLAFTVLKTVHKYTVCHLPGAPASSSLQFSDGLHPSFVAHDEASNL